MIFDLFHSISDPQIAGVQIGPEKAWENFFAQSALAESLGFDTVWLAESHFSSETQKQTSVATIPHFRGEVGLNCDSFQAFHLLNARTKKINFGTGIHNIIGGSGGPIASAERVNFIRFVNEHYWGRILRFGVASGRFPYQNTPFGITPRDEMEEDFWPSLTRIIFLEGLEIFLRLVRGETLDSQMTSSYEIKEEDLKYFGDRAAALKAKYAFPLSVKKRWEFESLKLVPESKSEKLRIVLGSSDPRALAVGSEYWDLDLFNLSFTPPDKINALHAQLTSQCQSQGRVWKRSRLPRTVLTFVDPDQKKAEQLASDVIDQYIKAMQGTAQVPDKGVLLERALIGDAVAVREQLSPDHPKGFHPEDRLMLWFEFNQSDNESICRRMRYLSEEVLTKLSSG